MPKQLRNYTILKSLRYGFKIALKTLLISFSLFQFRQANFINTFGIQSNSEYLNKSVAKYNALLTFPGQNAPAFKMAAKALYSPRHWLRNYFKIASNILNVNLTAICLDSLETKQNSEFLQPVLFLYSVATALEWMPRHPELQEKQLLLATGFSLGEISALCISGAITLEQGIELTALRGRLMHKVSKQREGGMLVISGIDEMKLTHLCSLVKIYCGEPIYVSSYLNTHLFGLSGTKQACDAATHLAVKHYTPTRIRKINVAGPFHSPLMSAAAQAFAHAVNSLYIKKPEFDVLSTVKPFIFRSPDEIRSALIQQICNPICWHSSLKVLQKMQINKIYEIGPGNTMRPLLKLLSNPITDIS